MSRKRIVFGALEVVLVALLCNVVWPFLVAPFLFPIMANMPFNVLLLVGLALLVYTGSLVRQKIRSHQPIDCFRCVSWAMVIQVFLAWGTVQITY